MTFARLLGAAIASAMQSRRREGTGAPPAFQSSPVILGTPTVGVPVAFTRGSVNGLPTPTMSQQWLIAGANIPGATNLTYTPQDSDAGKQLAVRETATNINGSDNRTSTSVVVAAAQTAFQVNLPTSDYFDVTPIFTDLVTQGFGLMVQGTSTPVAVSPTDGWPTVANSEVVTQLLPAMTAGGSVVFEFDVGVGTATYAMRSQQVGDSLSTGAWNSTTKKQQVTYSYTAGRPKATMTVQITGARRIDGVSNGYSGVRAARPGYTIADLSSKQFTDQLIASIAKVKVLRLMDWCPANGSGFFGQGADFNKRPTPASRRTTWSYSEDPTGATAKLLGHAYETMIALANRAGKDLWVCVPFHATPTYVAALATLLHNGLNPGLRFIIEHANEMWNSGFGYEQSNRLMEAVSVELNGFADNTDRTFGNPSAVPHTRYITTATRTAGIVTLTFSENHAFVANGTNQVRMANIDGIGNTTAFTITATPAPNQISFAKAGADGAVSINSGSFVYDANTTSNLVAGTGTSLNLLDARLQWAIRQAKSNGEAIRSVVGDAGWRTRGMSVYCWQGAGTEFERELRWLKQAYPTQDPGYWVPAVGHAPYFSLDGTPVGLGNLAGDSNPALVVNDYVTVMAATAKVAKRDYGYDEKVGSCVHYSTPANPIELLCYEAGPDTSTLGGSLPNGSANNVKKSQAQIAAGFQQPMVDFYSDIIRYGTSGTIPAQYWHGEGNPNSDLQVDRWWTSDDISVLTRPKIAAINAVAAAARPAPTRCVGLGTFDFRLRAGFYEDIDPALLTSGTYPWLITSDINFNTQAVTLIWYETASTPQTRSWSGVYVCNFNSPWLAHVDINGVRVAASQVLSATPADLTTEKTLGTFTFTSRPAVNGRAAPNVIRVVRAGGGRGRDGQLRRWTVA